MNTFHAEPNIYAQKIDLKVTNLQTSLRFYQDILGFQVLHQSKHEVSLSADGNQTLVQLHAPEGLQKKELRRTGLYHFAILLPTRNDLAKIIRHFIKVNYPLQGASDHDVSEALYLADPDGNGIEIYADRPKTSWDWKGEEVVMGTNALDVQSIMSEWDGNEWNGMPNETIMGHIHLHVNNIEEAKTFYCEGLGFEVVTHYGNQALFISTGKYHHHIGLNIWNGTMAVAPSANSVGMAFYTLVFPKNKLEQAVERLQAMNIEVERQADSYMVSDPAGNNIKLVVE
ncbi:VOC family protein [Cytobacillus sp. FSL W7-1323]|uniref:Glyoxalase n=1 Tax=Cytobacillus kochii TaxID=859143 RepID=A0A248TGR0_9BACI|nr:MULTISPECIES: VOC family protein [Cytobacillus]ASV67309.1 glyoxalase [Cytobacillus kochii]MDQ0185509.1 catechol 2,3-dioxygenase [Cytobacillus kochii]MEA1854953.1 VOC family protein [Cytobacillus sp. OWB-43]MED1606209.1 VOC family protein [Cytobacillus kochii]